MANENNDFVPQGAEPVDTPEQSGRTFGDTTVAAGGGMTATGQFGDPNNKPAEPDFLKVKDDFSVQKEEKANQNFNSFTDHLRAQMAQENQTTQPDVPPVQQEQVQTQNQEQSPDGGWEQKERTYLQRIQELEDSLVFQRELEKSPIEALAKYTPGVILNKDSLYYFDPQRFVQQKIAEKYGDAPPMYNPSEAYIPGTESYIYRNYVESVEKEAGNYRNQAELTEKQAQQKEEERFNQSKSAVMTKYGMDEFAFKTNIMDKLKGMDDSDRLMLISDALMIVDKNERVKTNVSQNTNQLRTMPPSVTEIRGAVVPQVEDPELAALKSIFGEERGARSSYL